MKYQKVAIFFCIYINDFFAILLFIVLLRVIYQGVLSTIRVQLDLLSSSVIWTWIIVTIILYFNLKKKVFTKSVGHVLFPFRKHFLEKNIYLYKTLAS